MIAKGFDVNSLDDEGRSVFTDVMYRIHQDTECYGSNGTSHRYEVVRQLLIWGANPNGHAPQTAGPLVFAGMGMDIEMIEILLDAGAQINATRILRLVPRTVYDCAEFEYRYAIWNDCLENADECFRGDEDEWLDGLDRAAIRLDRCRPTHLRLLRERGALSYREIF